MISKYLPLLFFVTVLTCKHVEPIDYFGQVPPSDVPAIFAPGAVSQLGRLEHGISFAPDGKEMAFGILDKKDFSGSIILSEKVDGEWSAPSEFEGLGSESIYLPYFSPDGKSMLYAQSRQDSINYLTDIWMVKKGNEKWATPSKIGMPVSSKAREASACMTLDRTIYFSSNRGENGLADLYSYALDGGDYEIANEIVGINTDGDEESIFVSPDESYIIFSRYATNKNGPDLFITYKDAKSEWTAPVSLDYKINTSQWERRPFVSIDHKYLFYTTLQVGETGILESDIYWVNTEKVFKPYVFNPISDQVLKLGEETALKIPLDYFKDFDGRRMKLSVAKDELDWVSYDEESRTLRVTPLMLGEYDFIFTAEDEFSNVTMDMIKIVVE